MAKYQAYKPVFCPDRTREWQYQGPFFAVACGIVFVTGLLYGILNASICDSYAKTILENRETSKSEEYRQLVDKAMEDGVIRVYEYNAIEVLNKKLGQPQFSNYREE